MNKILLEITEQEAGTLLELIHIACQARGLNVAQAASFFQQKINSAIAESKKAEPDGEAQPIEN